MKQSVLIFSICFLFFSTNAFSEERLNFLPTYPHVTEARFSEFSGYDYELALGAYKSKNSVWRPEKRQRLSGDLQRITYRVPSGHSPQEVFNHYVKSLQKLNAQTLFRCESFACGSSNRWANDTFSVRELYGPDSEQFYGAYAVSVENQYWVIAVYAIQRGNKRVYVHLDALSVSDAEQLSLLFPDKKLASHSSESVLLALQAQGMITLLPVAQAESKLVAVVASYLASLPEKHILLVGHAYDTSKTVDALSQLSLQAAESWKSVLIEQGVDVQRFSVYGLGPLSGDVDLNGTVVLQLREVK